MPNAFSKPLTDYYSILPRTERGVLQNNKNISDYVHRKELERLDAEERSEERLKQKSERQRDAKNAKLRQTRKRKRETCIVDSSNVATVTLTNNITINVRW